MCDFNDKLVLNSHSFCSHSLRTNEKHKNKNGDWKSDMHIPIDTDRDAAFKSKGKEYYKRYDHDEIPVKDFGNSNSLKGTGDSGLLASITSSLLDQIEQKVLVKQYESQELQTDGSSFESLDSHIKIFQTTVQKIFDTFYTNMRDYEVYKERYHEILEKNKTDTIVEMEMFIKDMIQHIVSTESSNQSISSSVTYDLNAAEPTVTVNHCETNTPDNSVLESYKNKLFKGESLTEENDSLKKSSLKSGEVLNIYLGNSSIEIKVNDRNICSEINIKDRKAIESKIASADNLKRTSDVKKEIEKYDDEDPTTPLDREIPIKPSSPKKNIHLNEDFQCEDDKPEKSLLSRLCSYLCRRFRK